MDTYIQKENFKNWLKTTRNVSDSTLLAYTDTIIERVAEIIKSSKDSKVKALNHNIYTYQTIGEFEHFFQTIKSDPNFDIVNRTGQAQSGWVSTPLNHYGKFLVQNGNVTINFTWIPFYKEFAKKLLQYQDNRLELINKIKDIFLKMNNLTLPTLERDNNIVDIDPFTVFGLFNKGITNNNRLELLSLIKEFFGINAEIPKDFNGIPVLNNQKATFYYFIGDRSDNDINNLWDLYKIALDYDKNSMPILESNFDNLFNTVKSQQGIKWNITMGLFWISPYMYINLDSKSRAVLQKESFISDDIKQKLKDYSNDLPNGKEYLDFCKQLRSELTNNRNGINDFPTFSFYADRSINYTINDEDFNHKEIDKMNIPLNQILYGPPGTGKTYNTVLKAMSILDNTEYKYVSDEKYSELKTRFDELKQAGQIEFVTFHQSYSYEEFVEGIKPYISEWGSNENADVRYVGENGIFKEICQNAKRPIVKSNSSEFELNENPKIWKVSLMRTGENEVRKDCMENNRVRIGFDKYGETITDETVFDDGGSRVLSAFIDKMEIGDVVLSCYSEKTIDAIGVVTSEYKWNNEFKDHKRYREVKWLAKGLNYNILQINNGTKFTLGTVYQLNNVSLQDVLDIVDMQEKVTTYTENNKPYILIIDEINRGDVSKIFGELITLIEEDKRIGNKHQMKITLPYSKESFGVPNNLYIIGTMNTADRSIALLDTALRRRFNFEEIMPKPELLNNKVIEDINLQTLLEKINIRITEKYDRDHQIGHSYLMDVDSKEQLQRAYKNRILPLLNEYFYNDSKTVSEVLNCGEEELKTADFIYILNKAQNDNN